MSAIQDAGAVKPAAACLLAALLTAGLPAPAAAEGGDNADGQPAQPGEMSVQEAWSNAKKDWRDLQAASGDAWGEARQQFQESWNRLQRLMSDRDGTAPPPDDPAALERGGQSNE